MMKKLITFMMATMLFSGTAFSEVLLEADFSGSPGSGGVNNLAIPVADPQLTVHPDILNDTFNVLGGTADTAQWVYDATGDSLLNTDLYTGPNWGGPTRMDLGLLLATFGKTYTITNVEVVVSASNPTDVSFDLWYARDDNALNRQHSPAVVIPAGTTGTFNLDASLLHLVADANEATWNQAGNGDLRLGFFSENGTNVDSIAIDLIRVHGTVEDYVAPVVDTDTSWNFNTDGDTEGWSQDGNAHIVGLEAVGGVLTADSIAANDPQLVLRGLYGPESNFWDKAIIRVRQLDTDGSPLLWSADGCAVVLGDDVVSSALGGSGWDVVTESGEWIVAALDISSLGTNQLEFLRFDPVGQFSATNKTFEVDYIQLTSTDTPYVAPEPDPSYWEFNTNGVLEGWTGSADISGLSVSGGVLFSQEITGNDPQLLGPAVSPADWYWTTAKVRVRQLDSGGTPLAWNESGCNFIINGNLTLPALGSAGWDVTSEADEWIVATLDISQFGSGDISSWRVDPVGGTNAPNKNFEVDYVRLDKSPTPPPPEANWEFNTDGDSQGWTGAQITDLVATNGVLTSAGVTGVDPKLNRSGIISSSSYTWTTAEVRLRQLDSGGNPIEFAISGLTAVIGGKVIQGSLWKITPEDAGEWVVAEISLAAFGTDSINGLRIDPVGNDATKNFEVDYIRLNHSVAPMEKILVRNWEFNSGSAEDLEGNAGISGLLATDAYSGSEKVLTCVSVTSNDPQILLPNPAGIVPDGAWSTLEFRARQLSADGGPFQAWSANGTIVLVNGSNLAGIPGANVTVTTESDGWIVAKVDISAQAFLNLNNFRLDPVGNDPDKNFEIDYIRVYSLKERVGYDVWTYSNALSGPDADSTADPDEDLYDNFYEYAFGGDPNDPMDIGPPAVASVVNVGSNVLEVVSYERSDANSGVDYSLEANTDLAYGSWDVLTEAVDYTVAGTGNHNAEMNAVTNHVPTTFDIRFIQPKAAAQ